MLGNINNTNQTHSALNIWKVEKPEDKKSKGISEAAEKYLELLKTKYGNVGFIVADYKTEEEKQRLLAQGGKEYNCLISPELLEEMAADEATAAKYEAVIDNAITQVDDLKEQLGEKAEMIKNYNVTIDGSGKVEYSVMLKEGLDGLYDVKKSGKVVKAGSIEELMQKLDELDLEKSEKASLERRKELYSPKKPGKKDGFGKSELDELQEMIERDIERKHINTEFVKPEESGEKVNYRA